MPEAISAYLIGPLARQEEEVHQPDFAKAEYETFQSRETNNCKGGLVV